MNEHKYPVDTPRELDRLFDDEFIKLMADKSILFDGLIEVRSVCYKTGCTEGVNKINEVLQKYFHP